MNSNVAYRKAIQVQETKQAKGKGVLGKARAAETVKGEKVQTHSHSCNVCSS